MNKYFSSKGVGFLKWAALASMLAVFSALHLATSSYKCDDLCQRFIDFEKTLQQDRPYVWSAHRPLDTLIEIRVNDSISNHWQRFSDTACLLAKSKGLPDAQVLILNLKHPKPDTLARKDCR
ncbi:MAG TPA: hypothetical protein VHK69_20235 [Chitinophagaceae bacterium]|jgi:hypothetical protein|nr:hypothetical protein [Chitinophagaceae bacterium]